MMVTASYPDPLKSRKKEREEELGHNDEISSLWKFKKRAGGRVPGCRVATLLGMNAGRVLNSCTCAVFVLAVSQHCEPVPRPPGPLSSPLEPLSYDYSLS